MNLWENEQAPSVAAKLVDVAAGETSIPRSGADPFWLSWEMGDEVGVRILEFAHLSTHWGVCQLV